MLMETMMTHSNLLASLHGSNLLCLAFADRLAAIGIQMSNVVINSLSLATPSSQVSGEDQTLHPSIHPFTPSSSIESIRHANIFIPKRIHHHGPKQRIVTVKV